MSLYLFIHRTGHSPHLCLTLVVGQGGIWEIEMKGQTCRWGRLWHKCSLGCQHGAEVGQGDTGDSGTQGQPSWGSCSKCQTQQVYAKTCHFTLCQWGSSEILSLAFSQNLQQLLSGCLSRFTHSVLIAKYLQSPTHWWINAAVNTRHCPKLDRCLSDCRGTCWAIISTFHTSDPIWASHFQTS